MRTIVFLFLCMLSTHAWCEAGDHYNLIKPGSVAIDGNNASNLTTLGFTYGIGMTLRLSAELEGNVSTRGGDYSSANKTGKYELVSLGGYFVHRESITPMTYAKAKVGVILVRIDISDDTQANPTQINNIAASLGLGLGWAIPMGEVRYTLELEATLLENNLLLFSLGVNFGFL